MAAEQGVKGFTLAERDRRWAKLRELMGQQGVDVLLVFPRWMPGDALFIANTLGAVIFPREGEPTFIAPRAVRSVPADAWIQDVRPANPSGSPAAELGAAVAARLREMGAGNKRIAVAGLRGGPYTLVRNPEGYVNYTSLAAVQQAVPEATIVDGTPILGEARYVKSAAEIEALRASEAIAEASAAALAQHARPGVRAAAVYAEMVAEQLRQGADEAHVAWGGGPWGQPKRRMVSAPPGVIERGWMLKNEIEVNVLGYTSQIASPVCVGPVPPDAQELFDLGKEAFLRACELMRPGVTWGEVIEQTEAVARDPRYKVEFLVHGRGLGDEGPMFIPTDDHRQNPLWTDTLRANTLFILKPYAYRADGPRDDWSTGYNVTWGDTVLVGETGTQRLGARPHALVSVS
jgi:Xaa-Pro aminopeptidase